MAAYLPQPGHPDSKERVVDLFQILSEDALSFYGKLKVL